MCPTEIRGFQDHLKEFGDDKAPIMNELEALDGTTWEGLLAAPWSVLMLGKSDCDHCNEFTEELHTFLAADQTYADVRFGKILLDRGGLASFKRANPWLADVDVLPYTLIYRKAKRSPNSPAAASAAWNHDSSASAPRPADARSRSTRPIEPGEVDRAARRGAGGSVVGCLATTRREADSERPRLGSTSRRARGHG